jgi:Tfp pilus assembly protein PilE
MINKRKKIGISLIVLVITIIVIIILAGSVILSLAANNPILTAKEAQFKSDMSEFNSELQLWISSQYVTSTGTFDPKIVNIDNADNKYNGLNIGQVITSLKGDNLTKFKIIGGKLVYADTTNINESNWANQVNVARTNLGTGKNIYVSDSQDSFGTINNISGESLQNSIPAPTSPATILNAGDGGNVKLYTHSKNFLNYNLISGATTNQDQVNFNIFNSYDHLILKGQLGLSPSTQYNLKMIITENTATLPLIFQNISTCAFDTMFSVSPGQIGEINTVITTKADFKNVLYDFWLWHSNSGTGNIKFKVQLTQGPTIQNYEPFVYSDYILTLPANFLLAKLPSGVSDTIDSTGLCSQKIVKAVLNGSETWTLRTVGTNTLEFLCPLGLPNHMDNSIVDILCDRFTPVNSSDDTEHMRGSAGASKDYALIYINKTRLATQDVAGLKTWLAANPVTVIYETTNVITPKITLPLFKTYQGDTYITTKNLVQPDLNINYTKNN